MTVVPPGLIDLPDVPPIVEQHAPPWARPAPPRRSPVRRAALVALVLVTILAGASAVRDRSASGGPPDGGPAPISEARTDPSPTLGG